MFDKISSFLTPDMAIDLGTANTLVYVKGKRSEEHTSELQSQAYLVCRLLLEKKKAKKKTQKKQQQKQQQRT